MLELTDLAVELTDLAEELADLAGAVLFGQWSPLVWLELAGARFA